jgi:hypothetical protein
MNRSSVQSSVITRAVVGALVMCAGVCAPALASAPPSVVPSAPAPTPASAGPTAGVIVVPGTGGAMGAGTRVRISLSAGGDVRIRRPGGEHVAVASSAGAGQSNSGPVAGALGEHARDLETTVRPRLRSNEAQLPDGRVVRLSGARSAPQGDGGLPPERPAAPSQPVLRPGSKADVQTGAQAQAPSKHEKPAQVPAQGAVMGDAGTDVAHQGKTLAGKDAAAKSGGKDVKPSAGKEGAQVNKIKPAASAKPAPAAGGVGTVRREAPKPAQQTAKDAQSAPAAPVK